MWFYIEENIRKGPVGEDEVKSLVADAVISRTTLVWKEGMSDWSNAQDTELLDYILSQPPAVPSRSRPPEPPPAPTSEPGPDANPGPGLSTCSPESIKVLWHVSVWAGAASFAVILLYPVMGFLSNISGAYNLYSPHRSLILFCSVIVTLNAVAGVAWLMLLYRCWSTIQGRHARITPGKAVGFLFIPFFNLYWLFVCIYGLAKDTNQFLSSTDGVGKSVSEGLALTACILMLCGILPVIGIIPAALGAIALWVVMHQMTRVTEHVIEQGHQASPA